MGGKSSQSTQQIQIPPEVLARYNAVNARAETVADRPFQQYSTDPNAFVAPLTETQQAGIAGTNQYAQTAQPYYQAATQQLGGAQATALPFYGQAARQTAQAQDVGSRMAGLSSQTLGGAQDVGSRLANLSYESLYGGQQAAQTPQQQAYGAYNQAYSGAQPYQAAATGLTLAGAQGVNPGELGPQQINQYMSPYLANVLQGTAALQNQMNQQAMSGQTGNAIRQGAFGGDRAGIAAANLAQQQQLANAKTFSDILNQGYGQGLATAQQQQQLGLSAAQANRAALQQAGQQLLGVGQQGFQQGLGYGQAQQGLGQQLFGQGATSAQQLANLGQQQFGQGLSAAQQQAALGQQQFAQGLGAAQQNAALGAGLYGMGSQTAQQLAALGVGSQSAGLQGAQAQLAAGQAQQQTEQAGKQALYNQFLQQQSYPFQVAQFLANIAMGTGALSGSTTQTNQAMGGFSDKRLKENIKPVGKTFDGQTIYSYNFKGEPQTEIGLIAQEVEKHHPEAVGLAGGYKTVRYDKATEDAADRGHFAAGGAAMGGGVMPYHAGEGFFDGGSVGYDPALMQQILSSYQQMYAPMQGAKGGLGAASFVPEANLPVGQLMTAGALPDAPDPMAGVGKMVDIGTKVGELGGNLGAWDYTDAQRAETKKKEEAEAKAAADKARQNVPDPTSFLARGGVAGAEMQGIDSSVPTELKIPNEEKKHELAVAGDLPEPPKDNTADMMKAAAQIAMMFAARGGRIGYADGGMPYSAGDNDPTKLGIPDEKNTNKLATPGEVSGGMGGGGGGNTLGTIGKVAGLAANLIPGGGIVTKGLGAIGKIFSDERLKENIKPVGKTFDGQVVYSYNYKGDHQTRMGLLAQEVAKHHPDAVGKSHGFKTVDYKKATGVAAHRGHFAAGGDISGLGALEFKNEELEPDFNLDPEDLTSGGDEDFEYLMRSFKKPEAAQPQGLEPLTFGDEAMQHWGEEKAARAERAKKYSGLGAAANQPSPKAGPTKGGFGVRSVRNNNPGNIEDGSFAKSLPGYAGSDGRFAIFENPGAGRSAQMALIRSYINRGFDTPYKIANRWAPPTEKGNDLPMYAKKIADMAGVGIHDRVTLAAIPQIANAQTIVEGGQRALQHFLPGKSEGGGLAGRPHKQFGGTFEEEFDKTFGKPKATGLAAAEAPAQPPENVDTNTIEVAAPKKPAMPEGQALVAKDVSIGTPANVDIKKRKPPIDEEISRIPGYNTDYFRTPFFKGLGRGSAQSWIPLLTGLGTFATMPTRSALSGLLAGVGAGAQSYANIAAERNKQLPLRQSAASKQAEVAQILSKNLLRQNPDDPTRMIYLHPSARNGFDISIGEGQAILQKMMTGDMTYMPEPPKGALEYTESTRAPAPTYQPSKVAPSNNSVEGIIEGAMRVPEVQKAYNDYLAAKAEMSRLQKIVNSPFGSPDDKARAVQALQAAGQIANTNKATFESLMSRNADTKLAVFNTSAGSVLRANEAIVDRRMAETEAYRMAEPVLRAIEANGYGGSGSLTQLLNWGASVADTIGLPKSLFGDIRDASQRQEALTGLLAGTGLTADAATIERDPVAFKAVIDAIRAKGAQAQAAANEARNQFTTTATPKLIDTRIPEATPGRGAAPGQGGPEPRRMEIGNGRYGYASDADALNDPRLSRGARYRVWDGTKFGPEKRKP